MKHAINYRHDTHIKRTYFEDKDYIMELDEEIWGKGKIVFNNATVKHNSDKQDIYWLYEEIYKVLDKLEIHISFHKSKQFLDIIVLCDDVHVIIEEKEYFKSLYKEIWDNSNVSEKSEAYLECLKKPQDMNFKMDDDKIIKTIESKISICGFNILNEWEKLVFSFSQLYGHIKYYQNRNIDDLMINHYYTYSEEKKEDIYIQLFLKLENDIRNNIKTLTKYKDIIKEKDLDYIINRLSGVYDKKNISIKEKNKLYLKLNENLMDFDFNKIYKRILNCINEGIIK